MTLIARISCVMADQWGSMDGRYFLTLFFVNSESPMSAPRRSSNVHDTRRACMCNPNQETLQFTLCLV